MSNSQTDDDDDDDDDDNFESKDVTNRKIIIISRARERETLGSKKIVNN